MIYSIQERFVEVMNNDPVARQAFDRASLDGFNRIDAMRAVIIVLSDMRKTLIKQLEQQAKEKTKNG